MTLMKVQVRPVADRDWLGVLHVEQSLRFPWDLDDHKEFRRPRRNWTHVAVHRDHVLGFVCVTLLPDLLVVERVGVDPDWRRRGIGYGLLDWAEYQHAGGRRKRLVTVVSEYDVTAQLFLRACGWRCTGTVRWADEIDEYQFTKGTTR